ncbi:AsmA-like C-terminal region-containing protein [Winogradskyella sp. DF17]|uniref:AsmA-like C-terminal region-containing protein n=1 Tax=Winogradskyella pelagia TaxID=2819984 RepID=A0ABS3T311_9FLAO|nr:AsmA-like C-terminal region-containing protein [Winogradskyella sp. DF17]MBO3117126.1 AsmA-like C-terminal region-containing protein [Winogradskyella sp. DF17]
MKKLFKILALLLLLIISVLIATPFFLESKIETIVQNYADNNLNADLSFDDISLSLIKSFPNAEIHVEALKIINRAPFKDEIFATAKDLSFKMPIKELLNSSEEPLTVNEIIAEELLLTLKTNANGTNNYDLLLNKESAPREDSSKSNSFSFNIENYEVNNSAFTYINEENNTKVYLSEFNHKGNGIFSDDQSELDTQTNSRISISSDSTDYLSNNTIKLDALIDVDLDQNTYTFKDNKALINALPLEFEGYLKLVENGEEFDIKFKNPESSFKDFLAIIPSEYSKNINEVSTTGNFTVNGRIKGLLSEETIPTFDIQISSKDASFKYPSLSKAVKNIKIDAKIKNSTGLIKDTYVDINQLDFKIDDDTFKSEAHIKDLDKNIKVNANLDGVLNLANITKAYPLELKNQLTGVLKGKLNTSFDMDAIEKNDYKRIKNNGSVSVLNFVFSSKDIVNPIQINKATLDFKPGLVSLNSFNAITGTSDFSANGNITNLLGFLLSDKKLQGNFNVNSSYFVIADFMVEDDTGSETSNKSTSDVGSLKIPDFLDCTIKANAKTVVYDNLSLKNVKGEVRIQNQNAKLVNMTSDLFNGQLAVSGNISTKEKQPDFDMKLGMQDFDISKSFEDLKLLETLAPIAKVLKGKLNASIDVNGLLDGNFSPDLKTIAGNAEAEVLTTKINTNESAILNGINQNLNFINLNDLNLKDFKTTLSFKDGNVLMQPFTIKYKDIPIEIKGSHSFDNVMDYDAVFQVPAKYLGSDVNRLIGQINDNEVNNISVPVTAKINGTFSQPQITTDLSKSITNLSQQLIEIQKQKLINSGTDKFNDIVGGLLGGKRDTTKTKSQEDNIKKDVGSVLDNLLKGKKASASKKQKDSTKTN